MFKMKKRQMIILFSILAFVVLLVVLNSLVFSIREVRADCFNSNDTELVNRVTAASEIKLYKNIITLNKKKAIQSIDAKMSAEIKVINIERKFPNTVWIHFVKRVPVIAVETGGGEYVICDRNLTITESGVPLSKFDFNANFETLDADRKKDVDPDNPPPVIIVRVLVKGGVLNPAQNKPLELSDAGALDALSCIVDTVNRLDYEEYDFVRLLKEIDMTNYNDAVTPEIELKMRDSGGKSITIKIQNAKNLLLQKVWHSISVYEQYLKGTLKQPFKNTTWTVFNDSKGQIYIEDTSG